MASPERLADLRVASIGWPSWTLSPRQLADVELLLSNAFFPLTGFMGSADYGSCRTAFRLSDGHFWPVPILLDVPQAIADGVGPPVPLVLRDGEGAAVACLHVTEVWPAPKDGTVRHEVALAGRLEGFRLPQHHDFPALRFGPSAVRGASADRGWSELLVFQTHGLIHRAEVAQIDNSVARNADAVLVQVIATPPTPPDLNHFVRVRSLLAALRHVRRRPVLVSLLPLADHGYGAREVLLQSVVARNFGGTQWSVGHAGWLPSGYSAARNQAEALLSRHRLDLHIEPVQAEDPGYPSSPNADASRRDALSTVAANLSREADLRSLLALGGEPPEEFSYPEVLRELKRGYPPRSRQGFTVFFTGLSGSGKSTIANLLRSRLLEATGRQVTLLDGDLVRKHLSADLGFSREQRAMNIRRIGFVAAEVTKHGGIAVCAPIAPYDADRKVVRRSVEEFGGFVLVHVDTPIEICEGRDSKGLYAKARSGLIREFTGVSDPYEPPADAEIVIDTNATLPQDAVDIIVRHLVGDGYLDVAALGSNERSDSAPGWHEGPLR